MPGGRIICICPPPPPGIIMLPCCAWPLNLFNLNTKLSMKYRPSLLVRVSVMALPVTDLFTLVFWFKRSNACNLMDAFCFLNKPFYNVALIISGSVFTLLAKPELIVLSIS